MLSEEERKAKEHATKQVQERNQRHETRTQTNINSSTNPNHQRAAISSLATTNSTSHIIPENTILSSSTLESVKTSDSTIEPSTSSHPPLQRSDLHTAMNAQFKAIINSIPTFSGETNEKVNEWFDIICLKFDILAYELEQRRRFIPQYPAGNALKWHLAHRQDLPGWTEYADAIKAAFPQIVTTSRDMNIQLLRDRKQGSKESFNEYYASILQLCRQHNPDINDDQIIDWLKGGMQLRLYERLQGEEFNTPQKLLVHVQRLEQDNDVIEARKREYLGPSNFSFYRPPPTYIQNSSTYYQPHSTIMSTSSYPPPLMSTPSQYTTFPLTSTPQPSSFYPSSFPSRRPIICYTCGQPGHISPQCSSRPNY